MKLTPPNPHKLAKGEDGPTGAGRQAIKPTTRSVTMSPKRLIEMVKSAKKAHA